MEFVEKELTPFIMDLHILKDKIIAQECGNKEADLETMIEIKNIKKIIKQYNETNSNINDLFSSDNSNANSAIDLTSDSATDSNFATDSNSDSDSTSTCSEESYDDATESEYVFTDDEEETEKVDCAFAKAQIELRKMRQNKGFTINKNEIANISIEQ